MTATICVILGVIIGILYEKSRKFFPCSIYIYREDI